jgi:hypothetical protein
MAHPLQRPGLLLAALEIVAQRSRQTFPALLTFGGLRPRRGVILGFALCHGPPSARIISADNAVPAAVPSSGAAACASSDPYGKVPFDLAHIAQG